MFKLYYGGRPLNYNRSLLRSTVEVLDQEYIISVEVPGVNKDDIKVSLEDNVLSIDVNRTKEEGKEYYLDERYYGEVGRSFTLKDIKDGDIKATYVDGVLRVSVPKLSEEETKKIIKIA